ncbi:hypothetical protein AbraIFM66951_003702 [Aspergillus brasiliensis]|uniref:HypA-like protein n=1 Tax=Aspergillus brasiliensis TaxID=319629 RepID=A0A9W5YN33_9EURO|nr:hypothetical protein AbraCBS73388_004579 [Aspergillus brasiliensis]GKZ43148.1 hypothetical protein AbraIFM66951_003702 [Aspergillus brasiliensis]
MYQSTTTPTTIPDLNTATSTHIYLSPKADPGIISHNVTEESARVASDVLQKDMRSHHVFFNQIGFHNHIPHHILSLYALGATPEQIQAAYEKNSSYQRPRLPVDEDVVRQMKEEQGFLKCLGQEKHYSNFLTFFQRQMEDHGVEWVLGQYLFSDSRAEVAEKMLGRLFGGLIHPFIQFGFGLEFNQPAIMAQGLAQTAVHEDWYGPLFFWPVEKAAGGVAKHGGKSMLQILEEIRADEKLARSAQYDDSHRMKTGVLKRAPDEMIKYAAEFTVPVDRIEEKAAEIINTVAYFASAAQRPDKQIKFDFFYIHGVNSTIFLSKIIHLSYLDVFTKARIVEWVGRLDLLLYVAYGAAELHLDEVTKYPVTKGWEEIYEYCNDQSGDDGHLPKLVRALKNGERACRPFEYRAEELGLKIKGDMWLKIANMVMDSTAGQDPQWVRGAGFDEAWKNLEERRSRL